MIDVGLTASARSIKIDSASSSITVFTPAADSRFVCLYLVIQAETAGSVQVQSGSTDISGPIDLAEDVVQVFGNAPCPVFLGRAAGEAMKIANAGTVQLNGTAFVLDVGVKT